MSGPTRITFPGLNGVRSATVERPPTGRRAVVVIGEPGDEAVAPLRSALAADGFVAASLDPSENERAAGLSHIEDLAALLGTLFGSSSATVGLVALGKADLLALAATAGLYDVVSALVLVGGEAAVHGAPVPVVQLDAGAPVADVVNALRPYSEA